MPKISDYLIQMTRKSPSDYSLYAHTCPVFKANAHFAFYRCTSSHWRRMWECLTLHHRSFTHHDGGVRVRVFTVILTTARLLSTPPLASQITPSTFPANEMLPSQWKAFTVKGNLAFKQTPLPFLRTPTHSVTHSASHTQTQGL